MDLELTDEQATALLEEPDNIIDDDRYFPSQRIRTLKEIRTKMRPDSVREPFSPPPKQYAPPRASAAKRRRRRTTTSGGGRRSLRRCRADRPPTSLCGFLDRPCRNAGTPRWPRSKGVAHRLKPFMRGHQRFDLGPVQNQRLSHSRSLMPVSASMLNRRDT
jgi:hypothetical protein